MNEKNNDKWLDEIISKTINSKKPQFDVEKFKQEFPEELQMLKSRELKKEQKLFSSKSIFNDPISLFATAAVTILTIGLFMFFSFPKDNIDSHTTTKVKQSPIEMMTEISLERAFRRGGIEAIYEQSDRAFGKSTNEYKNYSLEELFNELEIYDKNYGG